MFYRNSEKSPAAMVFRRLEIGLWQKLQVCCPGGIFFAQPLVDPLEWWGSRDHGLLKVRNPQRQPPKKGCLVWGLSLSTPIRGLLSPILVRAVDWSLPSSNQTWLAGKSIINEGMMGNQLQMGDFPLPHLTTAGYSNN